MRKISDMRGDRDFSWRGMRDYKSCGSEKYGGKNSAEKTSRGHRLHVGNYAAKFAHAPELSCCSIRAIQPGQLPQWYYFVAKPVDSKNHEKTGRQEDEKREPHARGEYICAADFLTESLAAVLWLLRA